MTRHAREGAWGLLASCDRSPCFWPSCSLRDRQHLQYQRFQSFEPAGHVTQGPMALRNVAQSSTEGPTFQGDIGKWGRYKPKGGAVSKPQRRAHPLSARGSRSRSTVDEQATIKKSGRSRVETQACNMHFAQTERLYSARGCTLPLPQRLRSGPSPDTRDELPLPHRPRLGRLCDCASLAGPGALDLC